MSISAPPDISSNAQISVENSEVGFAVPLQCWQANIIFAKPGC